MQGDEAWVLLLEKAMAKFKGSYSALDGGFPLWALEALTSDYVFKFRLDEKGQWTRADIVHKPNGKGGYDVMLAPTDDVLDSDGMFEVSERLRWGR